MLLRVGLAVLISAVLIGGATFVRQKAGPAGKPSLIGAENRALDTNDGLNSTFWPEVASTSIPNLTKTDLISQQLLSDYISLASSGQDSADNVATLVQNYIDITPEVLSVQEITIAELKIIDDTIDDFQKYDRDVAEIEKEKILSINRASSSMSVNDLRPGFYLVADEIGSAYQRAAQRLKLVPVPASLVLAHRKLVNNYLATAAGMKAVAETEVDSISALIGIAKVNQSISEEDTIRSEIVAILIKNGI